jgi:hypothetical protein
MADRLVMWELGFNEEMAEDYFLNSPVRRGIAETLRFALRNESTQYTANNVVIRVEDVDEVIPSIADQMLFSIDGVTFVDVLSLGDIPPTALSSEIQLRRVVRTDAVSGSFVVKVEMTSWTT